MTILSQTAGDAYAGGATCFVYTTLARNAPNSPCSCWPSVAPQHRGRFKPHEQTCSMRRQPWSVRESPMRSLRNAIPWKSPTSCLSLHLFRKESEDGCHEATGRHERLQDGPLYEGRSLGGDSASDSNEMKRVRPGDSTSGTSRSTSSRSAAETTARAPEASALVTPKRKRGRPKRVSTSTNADAKSDAVLDVAKGKRKPGRPRGSATQKASREAVHQPLAHLTSEAVGAYALSTSLSKNDSSTIGAETTALMGAKCTVKKARDPIAKSSTSKEDSSPVSAPDDDSPAARRISIAQAATAAKKRAATASSLVSAGDGSDLENADDIAAMSTPPELEGPSVLANCLMPTGRAFRPTMPGKEAAERARPPSGKSAGDTGLSKLGERLPLLERAEVDAIMAASSQQGIGGPSWTDRESELDRVTMDLMLDVVTSVGEENVDLLEEIQELEAEWTSAAIDPGGTGSGEAEGNIEPSLRDEDLSLTRQGERSLRDREPQAKEGGRGWEHAQSLRERLSMSDKEVKALRLSGRAGLGTVEGFQRRLGSRSAGGPTTAVGYLLGELRMRPTEVKEALRRWPALLVMSNRGPHAVASWLQGGLGLSADDVCKMVKRHPALVACNIVHNLRPKLRWLQEEVGLSRPKSIRLVVRCPAIFMLSIEANMVPKVDWLRTKLRFSRAETARVIFANPGVLLSSVDKTLMPKIDWLVDALDIEENMAFDIIRRFPMFFTLSSEANLAPKLDWLSQQASKDIIRHVIFRQPSLLGHNAEGNLAPKVQWLQDRLGMSEEAAWKFIGKSPGFLTFSVTETLEPKLWWLRDKLDLSLEGAAKFLKTFPNFFYLSIEASLEPKLWWVRDALGLDRPAAAAIFRRFPQIFGASLKDTLEPKISWLTVRLKTDKQRVVELVKKYPQLLAYSIEANLDPTIDFFEYELGEVEAEDLMAGLEAKPAVLAASVEKRLMPRASKMRAAGIDPCFSTDFRSVGSLTDAQFKAWLARQKIKRRPANDNEALPEYGSTSFVGAASGDDVERTVGDLVVYPNRRTRTKQTKRDRP